MNVKMTAVSMQFSKSKFRTSTSSFVSLSSLLDLLPSFLSFSLSSLNSRKLKMATHKRRNEIEKWVMSMKAEELQTRLRFAMKNGNGYKKRLQESLLKLEIEKEQVNLPLILFLP